LNGLLGSYQQASRSYGATSAYGSRFGNSTQALSA
jgi:hypothetical protein